VADLQVSLALLLENEAELARALEAAGGKVGRDFGAKLSGEAKKAFDDLVSQAEKAAKDVGVQFSKQDLRFRDQKGKFLSDEAIRQLQQANKGFDDAVQGLGRLRSALNTTGSEGTRSLNLLESAVEGVAISLTAKLSDALISTLGKVRGLIGGFLELDGELRLAAAAAGEEGGYKRLGAIVDKVGIDAAGTSKQVAELATSLVRAGFSVSEVEAALAGVVRGAEATGTGFQQFGDIVGNTLRGFGLEVEETARVVDVLVNTANSSNASIEGLGYTFEYTAPIAKALGVSLEDVAAAAGLMANAGIQGSVAGTGLRTALQKLQQAAGGASPEVMGLSRGQERLTSVMRKLGATIIDANGKLLPMEQVILRLKAGLEKLNQADQVQLANILFGDEAGSKMLSITNQTTAAISKMFGDIRNSTGATNTAREAMAGMGLELQQLQGTVDSLGTTIGGVAATGLRPLVQLANALAGAVSGMPSELKVTAAALIALGAAAATASVAVGALNLVLAQVGGWAALRASVAGVAAVFVGPFAAGLLVVGGLVATVMALSPQMKEADKTAKALVQTLGALGTFVLVLKLITGAQLAWNQAAKVGVTLQTALAVLSGKGLKEVGLAAIAGIGAYAALGAAMKNAGQDAEEMSDKARELRTQIKDTQEQIQQQKALKLDSSQAEKRLAGLYVELLAIEQPLEVKLDIKKADAEIKALRDRLSKLGEESPARAPLQASIDGLIEYKRLLQSIESGRGLERFSAPVQDTVKFVDELKSKIIQLTRQKNELPLTATAKREQIDKEISEAQQRIEKSMLWIRLAIDTESINSALSQVKDKLRTAQGEERLNLLKQEERLELQRAGILQRGINLNKEIASIGRQQLQQAEKKKQTEQEVLKAQQDRLSVQERASQVEDQVAANDSRRIQSVQQIADAYNNLATAQTGLISSAYNLELSRNSYRLAVAERELQSLKNRGASTNEVAAAEARVNSIRQDGESIERRMMQANIEGAIRRAEAERRVLEIKQAMATLEQQSAVRSAEQGAMAQSRTLLELQSKLFDPNLNEGQKQSIQQQIELQRRAIAIANEQINIERGKVDSLRVIASLESEALAAQQGALANQLRGEAALKGWEESLGGVLSSLDRAVGITAENERYFRNTLTVAKELAGTIEVAGQAPIKIYTETEKVAEITGALAGGYAAANAEALKLLATVQALAKAPQARFAGGDAQPGQDYQVNELGQEAFLSRAGQLSLITAPRYGRWSPPSPGVVLPAHVTSHLKARGAFGGHQPMPQPVMAAAAAAVRGGGAPDFTPLQRSLDRLDATIRTHRPTVEVAMPGNAGLLHTLQSFR
jgi:TP901 family phage tail tape measure protein